METGDRAGGVALFTLFTLLVFWVAHSYSEILGQWSETGRAPTLEVVRRELNREWPMVVAPVVPLAVLAVAAVTDFSDRTAINLASSICVVELGITSFLAARRGGANLGIAALATATAGAFGVSIIILKLLLH